MKIVEFDFTRKVNASHAAIMWNYWDHEHLYVIHENYKDAKIIHENEVLIEVKSPTIWLWLVMVKKNILSTYK